MEIQNIKSSAVKILGGTGTVIGAFLSAVGLHGWYSEKAIDDISGNWKVTCTIEETSYAPFQGLTLGYTLFVEQEGHTVKGVGDKTFENGEVLTSSARTPIEVTGTFVDEDVQLIVKEKGKRRESSGMIKLKSTDDPTVFEGTFQTTAANASGRCTVELVK